MARRMQYRMRHGLEANVEDGDRDKLRSILHELSNSLTGMLVTSGLLRQALKGDCRERYSQELCEGGERSAALVREARSLLTPREEMMLHEATTIEA
jgi:nitrogen-specific signal transduction histidine kinase